MTELSNFGPFEYYATPAHPCPYVENRTAVSVFVEPLNGKSPTLYAHLSRAGVRRSGEYLYYPQCPGCKACQSVRLPVAEFQPNRTQRRNLKQNADLTCTIRPVEFDPDHFELYHRYLHARHPDGGMANPTESSYIQFIASSWCDTELMEMRLDQQLVGVAVIDKLEDGLSSVYTFFDPVMHKRSLGRFGILQTISLAQKRAVDWVYLGYWIEDSQKMAYKAEYRPQQRLEHGRWTSYPAS